MIIIDHIEMALNRCIISSEHAIFILVILGHKKRPRRTFKGKMGGRMPPTVSSLYEIKT